MLKRNILIVVCESKAGLKMSPANRELFISNYSYSENCSTLQVLNDLKDFVLNDCKLLNDDQHRTLSITLIGKLELIIEDQKELTLDNTDKIHHLALDNGLDTSFDPKSNCFDVVNSDGFKLVSFYNGFTRLVMEY